MSQTLNCFYWDSSKQISEQAKVHLFTFKDLSHLFTLFSPQNSQCHSLMIIVIYTVFHIHNPEEFFWFVNMRFSRSSSLFIPSITCIRSLPPMYTRNILCPDVLSFEQALEWSYIPMRTTTYERLLPLVWRSCYPVLSAQEVCSRHTDLG